MRLRKSSEEYFFSKKNAVWIVGVHLLAAVFAVPYFSWKAVAVCVVCHYLACMVGITFGFHRLLTHKGFVVPEWLERAAALCGTLACQGGPISWVGGHRVHHSYSDTPQDPHNAREGFWQAHMVWLFRRRRDLDDLSECMHYAPDLAGNPWMLTLEKSMILIQVGFALVLFLLGGWLGSRAGFDVSEGTSFVVWGIFVRLCMGYHVTWLVNSAAHGWGGRPNTTGDLSTNNWIVGLLAFGEGWHNNHHAQPRAARHGWLWWQFDQTWLWIRFLSLLGLVKSIRLPNLPEAAVTVPLVPVSPEPAP